LQEADQVLLDAKAKKASLLQAPKEPQGSPIPDPVSDLFQGIHAQCAQFLGKSASPGDPHSKEGPATHPGAGGDKPLLQMLASLQQSMQQLQQENAWLRASLDAEHSVYEGSQCTCPEPMDFQEVPKAPKRDPLPSEGMPDTKKAKPVSEQTHTDKEQLIHARASAALQFVDICKKDANTQGTQSTLE
jgi:hypothetical protein